MSLHDELQQIAARASVADVPADTWTRGRRSRNRRLGAGIAAAAVVVALAGGAVTSWSGQSSDPPLAAGSGGALPSMLWTLPEDVHVTPEAGLAIGPVSAAYVSSDAQGRGRVVAVTAADGDYHVIALADGFTGFHAGPEQSLALSPDGRSLAYTWAGTPTADAATPTGIRIVDLVSGSERDVALEGGQGILVRRMTWSPDGEWLVWSGQVSTHWGKGRRSFGDEEAAGLVEPGSETSATLPPNPDPDGVREYAVGDDGRVAILDQDRMTIWRDGTTVSQRSTRPRGTWSMQAQVGTDAVLDLRQGYDNGVPLVQHTATDSFGTLPQSFRTLSPLGWTADGHALGVIDDGASEDGPAIWAGWLDPESGSTYSGPVVTLEQGAPDSLTVASALSVDADLPTPVWADDGSSSVWWWIAGAGVLVLGGGALVVRRYRPAR